jgi:DNA-binding MurR/RpiR family transcriptional regulator
LLAIVDGVRLTPTQRRIAHCLFEHAPAVAYLSAAEVADLAAVSQPSVTRFAIALGYDGYPALRRALRTPAAGADGRLANGADGTPATSQAGQPGRAGQGDEVTRNDLQRAVRDEIDNLHRLADRLADGSVDRRAIDIAATALAASRPLPVLGLRTAAPLAAYFGYFAAKVVPEVRVLDHGGSLLTDRLEQARAAGATAMLGIVLPRHPRESLAALREAHAAGLTVVALTDSPIGEVADAADITLHARVSPDLVFDLHAAPMALSMILLQAICDAAPARTQARLEAFDASAARRDLFLN